MLEIALGVFFFTAIIIALVILILGARSMFLAQGNVSIVVNDQRTLKAPAGGKLLGTLAGAGIFVSSPCGGGGSCGQCRVRVFEGGGAILSTETAHINKRDARIGYRLSCQVAVKQDMKVAVPDEVFGVRKWECTVRSNHNVATFIKELILELPVGKMSHFVRAAISRLYVRRIAVPSRILTLRNDSGRTGIVSISGNMFQKHRKLLRARTRWRITRRNVASSR